ncbi:hypothetical protein [Mucilaginibacter agri]|uniref:DUF4251 domain-containing protein n=1 Tax=Mucilaginibacter agri TaxID=2695265 RepID=A0A965ZJE9_9SPHI|nr:hypothetical protein [Mucilaginibacter agri]NCD71203.1 hypothetical protein [Mucilaginibacter agri]
MMKKYLLAVIMLFLGFSKVQAQHINFQDMLSLVGASTAQINQFLTVGKKFEFLSTDMTQGIPVNKYQNRYGADGFRETVITGMGTRQVDGKVLHVLSYTTTSVKHINELIKQITKYGYPLTFKGNDNDKMIRTYESDLYSVAVYTPLPGKSGYYSVEVHEKRLITLD